MEIVGWTSIVFVAGAVGGLCGLIKGFAQAAHRDVLAGIRPNVQSRLLRAFFRPSFELSSAETLAVFGAVLLSVVAFFGLCTLPIYVAEKLGIDGAIPVSIVVALVALFAAAPVGRRLWAKVPKHAV